MGVLTRRELLAKVMVAGVSGVALASVADPSAAERGPLGIPIGCQVWPMRSMIGDFPALVKSLAVIGVSRLELCSPIGYGDEFASLSDPKQVRTILSDHGMKSESSHFTMHELRNSQEKSIAWAREIGIKQMITASLGDGNGGSHPTLDQVKHAAEEYNRIAQVAHGAGMQQGLHNEGFELSMVNGKRTYDLLFDLLDPRLVKFQFQMSTITAGFVAADYFQKYPGRFFSMHLQDIDMNPPDAAPVGPGPRRRYREVALGQGSIDWVKTFRTARVGGVRNYFIELRWDLVPPSVAFLKALRV